MSILDKFEQLRHTFERVGSGGHNPFSVAFDRIDSATEGVVDGRRVILLGTNNYLGLTFDAHGIEESVRAVQTQGTGTTGSRVANGSYAGHRQLEHDLAAFFGRRHGMVFSTGYQANLGMLSTVVGRGDHLILDSDSHASIYDGARLGHAEVIRFRHSDPEDLYKRLRRLQGTPGSKLVVVEGIYSMLGDVAPLREIAAVKREMGAYLMVDEAHSMGVLGEHGRGLAEAAGVEADVDFIVGTFSKSLGSVGGFCVSDIEGFDILRVASRPYMFTASLPPAVIASTRSALQRLAEDKALRTRLNDNAHRLHGGLQRLGLHVGPHVSPVVSVELEDVEVAVRCWNALLDGGIYLNLALPPATPTSRPLLRASVSAAHSPQQIDAAIEQFARVTRELGALPAEAPQIDFAPAHASAG
ncbi:serine palmitoyltransferase [Solimonas marina]|uniref:Pyridoxal phosphate-dependent aminotransferase family protein n=1 Tax=Solimonas marina TaxID=2714601 RepID=A0A970B5E0_9GAMM|nr:pyridoxal phosphate-dependent aminotransferase family protein [Solimonas marina]NKF23302.1 pyridoxal phosphate-dependent aminotransferase family protein [Solimonas marina]